MIIPRHISCTYLSIWLIKSTYEMKLSCFYYTSYAGSHGDQINGSGNTSSSYSSNSGETLTPDFNIIREILLQGGSLLSSSSTKKTNQISEHRTMPTLPTAFAETTRRSLTSADLRKRVLKLYRDYLREAPSFIELYELDMPVASVRTKIRQEFERYRFEKDLSINNIVYAKGRMEFQELVNFWKQQPHVYKYFEQEGETNYVPQVGEGAFMKKFLKGF